MAPTNASFSAWHSRALTRAEPWLLQQLGTDRSCGWYRLQLRLPLPLLLGCPRAKQLEIGLQLGLLVAPQHHHVVAQWVLQQMLHHAAPAQKADAHLRGCRGAVKVGDGGQGQVWVEGAGPCRYKLCLST